MFDLLVFGKFLFWSLLEDLQDINRFLGLQTIRRYPILLLRISHQGPDEKTPSWPLVLGTAKYNEQVAAYHTAIPGHETTSKNLDLIHAPVEVKKLNKATFDLPEFPFKTVDKLLLIRVLMVTIPWDKMKSHFSLKIRVSSSLMSSQSSGPNMPSLQMHLRLLYLKTKSNMATHAQVLVSDRV